ncbi:MAG: hypothetical protein KIH89_000450 [Candidatus Shapirobacteria bacterium]|nr:hypothetical protein [Candidatus Shapirobacteria bacterium]
MSMQEFSSIGDGVANWGRIAAEINRREPNSDCSKGLDKCESVGTGDDGYLIDISELIVREPDKGVIEVDFSSEVFIK